MNLILGLNQWFYKANSNKIICASLKLKLTIIKNKPEYTLTAFIYVYIYNSMLTRIGSSSNFVKNHLQHVKYINHNLEAISPAHHHLLHFWNCQQNKNTDWVCKPQILIKNKEQKSRSEIFDNIIYRTSCTAGNKLTRRFGRALLTVRRAKICNLK